VLDCLTHDFVENLLGDIGLLEPAGSILPDCRCVRRFVLDPITEKPTESHIVSDLFGDSSFGRDPVQIANKKHLEQNFRIDGGAAIVRTIERFTQFVDEVEIDITIDLAQQVILVD
jgi:hypothetical protein